MSVAFWNSRKKQKKTPTLHFQLKNPDVFLFKARYVSDQTIFSSYKCISRCNYEVSKQNLEDLIVLANAHNIEIDPIPNYIEEALQFDITIPFKNSFCDTKIWKSMFEYQREGVKKVITKFDGKAMICDEMGLGKSLQALAVSAYYNHKRVLVVCPAYLRFNWCNEIKKWIGKSTSVQIIKKGSDFILNQDGYLVTSYELATKKKDELKKFKFQCAIVDESHYLKSHKSKRTKGLTPVLKKMKTILLLTGTPCLNRSCELFSQAHIVRPQFFKNWRNYTKRYCDGQISILGFYEYSGNTNKEELHWLSQQTVMIRRKKNDVLKDLPLLMRSQVYFDIPEARSKVLKPLFKEWKQINKDIPKMVSASKQVRDAAFRRKAIISELFQKTAEAKLIEIQNYVKDMIASGIKFLIFGYHSKMLDAICETCKQCNASHFRIDGKTSLDKRNEYVNAFQENKIQVAVLSLLAASTGLTLTRASTVIFAELYWTSGTLLQAECRCHRIGQKQSCDIRYIIAKDTLDTHLFKMVSFKQENLDKTLDGGRHVDFYGLEDM